MSAPTPTLPFGYYTLGGQVMSIIPKKNPMDYTDDEVKAVRSGRFPAAVKAMLPRELGQAGALTSALRKSAALLSAERDAINAALDLSQLHGELADLAEAKLRLAETQRYAQSLEATVAQKDQRIMHLTALPAMAVSGGD